MAQRLSQYEKYGELHGNPFEAKGVKSLQFVKIEGKGRGRALYGATNNLENIQVKLRLHHPLQFINRSEGILQRLPLNFIEPTY